MESKNGSTIVSTISELKETPEQKIEEKDSDLTVLTNALECKKSGSERILENESAVLSNVLEKSGEVIIESESESEILSTISEVKETPEQKIVKKDNDSTFLTNALEFKKSDLKKMVENESSAPSTILGIEESPGMKIKENEDESAVLSNVLEESDKEVMIDSDVESTVLATISEMKERILEMQVVQKENASDAFCHSIEITGEFNRPPMNQIPLIKYRDEEKELNESSSSHSVSSAIKEVCEQDLYTNKRKMSEEKALPSDSDLPSTVPSSPTVLPDSPEYNSDNEVLPRTSKVNSTFEMPYFQMPNPKLDDFIIETEKKFQVGLKISKFGSSSHTTAEKSADAVDVIEFTLPVQEPPAAQNISVSETSFGEKGFSVEKEKLNPGAKRVAWRNSMKRKIEDRKCDDFKRYKKIMKKDEEELDSDNEHAFDKSSHKSELCKDHQAATNDIDEVIGSTKRKRVVVTLSSDEENDKWSDTSSSEVSSMPSTSVSLHASKKRAKKKREENVKIKKSSLDLDQEDNVEGTVGAIENSSHTHTQIESSIPSFQPGGGFNSEENEECYIVNDDSVEFIDEIKSSPHQFCDNIPNRRLECANTEERAEDVPIVHNVPIFPPVQNNNNVSSSQDINEVCSGTFQDAVIHEETDSNDSDLQIIKIVPKDSGLENSGKHLKSANERRAKNIPEDQFSNIPICPVQNRNNVFSSQDINEICSGAFQDEESDSADSVKFDENGERIYSPHSPEESPAESDRSGDEHSYLPDKNSAVTESIRYEEPLYSPSDNPEKLDSDGEPGISPNEISRESNNNSDRELSNSPYDNLNVYHGGDGELSNLPDNPEEYDSSHREFTDSPGNPEEYNCGEGELSDSPDKNHKEYDSSNKEPSYLTDENPAGVKDFIDDEAELSGDDAIDGEEGLGDEEEGSDNDSESELIDHKLLPEEELRDEIAGLHAKRMREDDEERVNQVREQLLRDELSHENSKRIKKFKWEDNSSDMKVIEVESSSNSEDEDTSSVLKEEHKRKLLHNNAKEDVINLNPSNSVKLNIVGRTMQDVDPGPSYYPAPLVDVEENTPQRLPFVKKNSLLNIENSSLKKKLKQESNDLSNEGRSSSRACIFKKNLSCDKNVDDDHKKDDDDHKKDDDDHKKDDDDHKTGKLGGSIFRNI